MSQEKAVEPPVEKARSFEVADVDHDFVERYHPAFLGKGGEHLVYSVPGYQVVVKANTQSIRRIIDRNRELGLPEDAISPDLHTFVKSYIAKEAARYRELTRYFGRAHVPGQRQFLAQVPVTQDILNEVYKDKASVSLDKTWALLTVQQRVPELADPERLSLTCGYAENRAFDPSLYAQVNARTIQEQPNSVPLTIEAFQAIQKNKHLAILLARAAEDPGFKAILTEFLGHAIRYSGDTGEILDLVGEDNATFVSTKGGWTYKLTDAFYSGVEKTLHLAKEAILKAHRGQTLTAHEKNVLLNTTNYVRTLNGFAELLGIQERLHLFPEELRNTPVDLRALMTEDAPNLPTPSPNIAREA